MMNRALTIQTIGSMIVIATFIASEAAVSLLVAHPGSAFAWYLNLEVFGVFERARAETSPLRFLFGTAAMPIAIAVLIMVGAIGLMRLRLGVAIAANLSFCFAIAFAALGDPSARGSAARASASLLSSAVSPNSATVTAVMLIASVIAALASHGAYFSVIRASKRREAT